MCIFQEKNCLKCSHFLFKEESKLRILEYWNTLVCADLASKDALFEFLPPLSVIGSGVPTLGLTGLKHLQKSR